MLPEQGLSMPTPNPDPTITIQNKPKLQPHDLPFSPIVAPTAAPDFRIRAGRQCAHLCKLFEELA
jgi:hypothetical protein